MRPRLTLFALSLAGLVACQPQVADGPTQDPTAASSAADACRTDAPTPRFSESPGGTPEIAIADVRDAACRLRIVDVRERDELGGELGMIAEAQHVPQRRVALEATGWELDEPIVLVCRSGRRSGAAARELQAMGFTNVASMTGGMLSWSAAGYPTADGSQLPARELAPPPVTGHALTRDEVAAHVGDRDSVRWAKAASLMLHGSQACVDGRDAHAIIGTPGGDAGELVLALAVAEQLRGEPLAPADVELIFDAYLEAFGHFYLHTDEHALAALLDRLHDELGAEAGALPSAHDWAASTAFMEAPPEPMRAKLLELLAEPAHVGCGHLRLMLKHPGEYAVRPELVSQVLRIFYQRLWAGHRALDFVVLEGGHEESAVVSIELAHDVHSYTNIPLVSPRIAGTEVFVVHPQVASFIRRENAAFLLEHPAQLGPDVDEESFYHQLEGLAAQQLRATVTHLAPDLPHYRVVFSGSGDDFEVIAPADASSPSN